jgi:hypothetical protein
MVAWHGNRYWFFSHLFTDASPAGRDESASPAVVQPVAGTRANSQSSVESKLRFGGRSAILIAKRGSASSGEDAQDSA